MDLLLIGPSIKTDFDKPYTRVTPFAIGILLGTHRRRPDALSATPGRFIFMMCRIVTPNQLPCCTSTSSTFRRALIWQYLFRRRRQSPTATQHAAGTPNSYWCFFRFRHVSLFPRFFTGILFIDLDWIKKELSWITTSIMMVVALATAGAVVYVDYINFQPTEHPWSQNQNAAYQVNQNRFVSARSACCSGSGRTVALACYISHTTITTTTTTTTTTPAPQSACLHRRIPRVACLCGLPSYRHLAPFWIYDASGVWSARIRAGDRGHHVHLRCPKQRDRELVLVALDLGATGKADLRGASAPSPIPDPCQHPNQHPHLPPLRSAFCVGPMYASATVSCSRHCG